MISKLVAAMRRLTRAELAFLALLLTAPFFGAIALILGAVGWGRAGLWVAAAYCLLILVAFAVACLARLRLRSGLQRSHAEAVQRARDERDRIAMTELVAASEHLDTVGVARARVLREHSERSGRSVHVFGARTKSAFAREIFALKATRGRMSFAELTAVVVGSRNNRSTGDLALGAVDLTALLALARLVYAQARTEEEADVATAYLEAVAERGTNRNLSVPSQLLLTERLILIGRADLAAPLIKAWAADGFVESMVRADAINPHVTHSAKAPEAVWLGAFNAVHRLYGLEPVAIDGKGATPYDRLAATVEDSWGDGPKVTIIMSCFQPDAGLLTAVRSVVAQSWTNWELLLMDDGSGEEFDDIFRRAKALDPRRVRVFRDTANKGTYARRNEGILASQGEFVTMHDSDDWAHPRRLEIQARHLVSHPEIIANTSASLRVSEDLMFAQPRGLMLRLTETSLMFRRDEVTAKIGFYDIVRKAADSEYRLRIEAAFGQTVPLLLDSGPLALIRYTGGSLSGSELGDGWMHPARVIFRSATRYWHRRIETGQDSPFLAYPPQVRRFPVHPHLLGQQTPATDLDLLVVLDGRSAAQPEGTLPALAKQIEAALDDDRTVGVLHVDSLTEERALGEFPDELQVLVTGGRVLRVLDTDPITAKVVVVHSASTLQGHCAEEAAISAARAVVLEQVESGRDRRNINFVKRDVDEIVAVKFGAEPEWRDSREVLALADLVDEPTADEPSVDDAEQAEPVSEAAAAPVTASDERVEKLAPAAAPVAEGTSYVAGSDTIALLIELAIDLPENATVVETGSGHSTMRLALAARHHGRRLDVISLEHAPEWAEKTEQLLADQGVSDLADVRLAPLETLSVDGEDVLWYAEKAWSDIPKIDLLFVDGPPASTGPHARHPAVPLLANALPDGALVLFDDANRDDEFIVLRDWLRADRGMHLETVRTVGRSTLLRVRR